MKITYTPIGIIHSPFHALQGMPIQPASQTSAPGHIELLSEYVPGLKDLQGFSHIILIYHLHESRGYSLVVTPFLDSAKHGVFATRAPRRPNPIGLSVVELLKIDGAILYVANLDVLDGTPLLDIKPFVPTFDAPAGFRLGWLKEVKDQVKTARSDARFENPSGKSNNQTGK
jgi:tRNA-Thr(GGU) m(6)t(6)A37 methyltransferase TsaA